MRKHVIPTLLETEDQVLFGLTARQVLILCVGLGSSYTIWSAFSDGVNDMLSFIVALLVSSIPTIMALLTAFVRPSGQTLEEWGMVWIFYITTPKTYAWEFLPDDPIEEPPQHKRPGVEEDD